MDIEAAKVWLQAINILGTFALGIWLYLEKRNDKTNERVTELASKVDKLDKNVASLETAAEAAPSHTDLGKISDSVNRLSQTVNQLVGENRGQSDNLRLILNHITQKGLS